MTIGNVITVPVTKYTRAGKVLKCRDCLYGDPCNCPVGVRILCARNLGWLNEKAIKIFKDGRVHLYTQFKRTFDITGIYEIINNREYFKVENNERSYVYCNDCGYIPYTEIDYETEFLDLHCKCGYPASLVVLSEECIYELLNDKFMSDAMNGSLE